jgi:hypothetical protein
MTTKTLEDMRTGPIKTDDATLTIQMPNDKLKVGGHTFQLVVADDSGNVSSPATVLLIVIDNQAPTAVLTVSDEAGRPIDGNRIPFGTNFVLNGKRSVDIGGGNIVSFTWTLVD